MAEPAGLLIRASVTEAALSSFLRRKIQHGGHKLRVGRVLSELLDRGSERGDILIVYHDAEQDELFIAWVLTRYATDAIAPVWPILQTLAHHISPGSAAAGAIVSTLSGSYETVRIEDGRLIREPGEAASPTYISDLLRTFWAFASNGQYPDAARSMRGSRYQCKAFRKAWRAYLSWREEEERPARIASATKADPFRLCHGVYCWEKQVFERDTHTRRDIPFPGADARTFRLEGGYFADKSQVWYKRLAEGSPPARIDDGGRNINNPDAIWEYVPVPGADGSTFTWLHDRFDTMFWRDAQHVYSLDSNVLISLPDVNPDQFRNFGQCFGTDGKSVFWFARRLPLDVENLDTNGFFIWDSERAFYCATELPLGGEGFRVELEESPNSSKRPVYRLSSTRGTMVWRPD